MNYTCFLQIKRLLKLCDNSKAAKRGEDVYDSAYKFNLIYKVIISNINSLSEFTENVYSSPRFNVISGSTIPSSNDSVNALSNLDNWFLHRNIHTSPL